jgi:hypothetical protein
MQWGDTSFVSDSVSSFIGNSKIGQNFINLRRPINKLVHRPSTYFDSRFMKIKILSEINQR